MPPESRFRQARGFATAKEAPKPRRIKRRIKFFCSPYISFFFFCRCRTFLSGSGVLFLFSRQSVLSGGVLFSFSDKAFCPATFYFLRRFCLFFPAIRSVRRRRFSESNGAYLPRLTYPCSPGKTFSFGGGMLSLPRFPFPRGLIFCSARRSYRPFPPPRFSAKTFIYIY